MPPNFHFLQSQWPELYNTAADAERLVNTAPRASAFYSRLALEQAVRWMYDNDNLAQPYRQTLASFIYQQDFKSLLPAGMGDEINLIRKTGNFAVNNRGKFTEKDSFGSIRYLYTFLSWFAASYSKEVPEIKEFDEGLIPEGPLADKSLAELQQLEKAVEARYEEQRRKALRTVITEKQKEQDAQHRLEIQQRRKRKKKYTVSKPYTEEETRTNFIDILLREAGWEPKKHDVEEYEVEGMPNKRGVGYVDYVLWGDDGKPLAVVEAKHTMHDARKGQHQAKLYADCLEKMHGQRPVIFNSNGFETRIWDDLMYPPRAVQGFYTKDELATLIARRETREDLSKQPVNKNIAGRYYQEEAIRRVAETFMGKRRGTLLVMATGSGKTRTAAAIVDMLTKANWVKRVLFLADRNALVTQAKNEFKKHLPHLTSIDLTKEAEDDTSRLVFSTYPTIMNRIDSVRTNDNRFYGPGHFDLVIIDEAHRSVYMKYKAIFEYFDALYLGLTATPKAEVDKNTYELFGIVDHDPTYTYELDKAVKDKYLVPPKKYPVQTKFHREGIKYNDLSEEEKEEYEATFRDDEGNVPEEIDATALNEWLYNTGTADEVLAFIMENGLKIAGGDKMGKTIVFAKSHKHAVFLEERFNALFPQHAGNFLAVIDNYIDYAQNLLDKFTTAEELPQIAISVDMLDTGIDVPEVLNLVIYKPVQSKAKFWQMIGRGTRLCPDIFGPGMDKQYFYVFDLCGNFEFFDVNPEGVTPRAQDSLLQKIFKTRLRLAEALKEDEFNDEAHIKLRTQLLDMLHASISGLNKESFVVRAKLRWVKEFEKRERWENLSRADIMDIEKHLSHLPEPGDDDELARRFDLLILQLQIAIIRHDKKQQGYIEQVYKTAKSLSTKTGIPTVAAQMPLIKSMLTEVFWKNITLPALEEVREALRDLVQFIDKEKQVTVYTSFEDEIVSSGTEEPDMSIGYSPKEAYLERVERFIREHADHLIIRKLHTNQPITAAELQELERMLFDGSERGTKEQFEKELGSSQPLGVFIRSIVGLDVKAAKEAFSEFLSKGNLTADQISFINSVIDHLTKNGIIKPGMLFDPPFTDFHYEGVSGVFGEEQGKIISIIQSINKNAMAG